MHNFINKVTFVRNVNSLNTHELKARNVFLGDVFRLDERVIIGFSINQKFDVLKLYVLIETHAYSMAEDFLLHFRLKQRHF